MMIDPVYRLDLYGLSSKLSQRHWAHLVQEHFSDHPDVVAKAKAALTAEESAVVQAAFGNVQYKSRYAARGSLTLTTRAVAVGDASHRNCRQAFATA
jgi:hypothetical protein